ncbi:MAG: transposase [Candidatus Moraniibacteriota bacterium]
MRKTIFAEGEFYHIYNRGTEKRTIFLDEQDFLRFLQSLEEFNTLDPVGGIFQNSFLKKQLRGSTSKLDNSFKQKEKLVNIVAYCLNPNHYHLILQQVSEKGIEKFMQRLGTGYTMYFNNKNERTGALFQGKFKAVHIDSNIYLLHVSAYVNLNDQVHQLRGSTSKSSWIEYTKKNNKGGICEKESVLGQFRTKGDYVTFAKNSIRGTIERRGLLDESILLEE